MTDLFKRSPSPTTASGWSWRTRAQRQDQTWSLQRGFLPCLPCLPAPPYATASLVRGSAVNGRAAAARKALFLQQRCPHRREFPAFRPLTWLSWMRALGSHPHGPRSIVCPPGRGQRGTGLPGHPSSCFASLLGEPCLRQLFGWIPPRLAVSVGPPDPHASRPRRGEAGAGKGGLWRG